MRTNETLITRAIIDRYFEKLKKTIEVDVAVVGAGPAGLVAAYYLAKAGRRVSIFERKLSIGGGIWGGGMLFNEIVVQEDAKHILDEFDLRANPYGEGLYTIDAVETAATLTSRAVKAGASVFNCISVEDVVMRPDRVVGVVLNWSPVEMAGLHVDPLSIRCHAVLDATGHATEVVHVVERKVPGKLMTPTGKIEGEQSMWPEKAEKLTLENTREVFPGLFIAGMAANAVFGAPRMGPIFGGMFLSGEKVAGLILKHLEEEAEGR
ncbi:MAG: thiazole biosynthesis protein [Candidatus Eisenbacteria sp.]|nr:thiazole biosynthesis protein [Candidatus Eisenbacteria bacterium]